VFNFSVHISVSVNYDTEICTEKLNTIDWTPTIYNTVNKVLITAPSLKYVVLHPTCTMTVEV
jgi:hypothetical protein